MNEYIVKAAVIPACFFIAKILLLKFYDEKNFLSEYCNFLLSVKNEVDFTNKPIREIINNCSDENFKNLSVKLLQNDEIEKPRFLSLEEYNSVKNFFSGISATDSVTLSGKISVFKLQADKLYEKSSEKLKKNIILYQKLGILSGILLYILIL